MRAEGETKGVIKRGEVGTEMYTRGFSYSAYFCVGLCKRPRGAIRHAYVQLPCKQVGPPLRSHTHTHAHTQELELLPTD